MRCHIPENIIGWFYMNIYIFRRYNHAETDTMCNFQKHDHSSEDYILSTPGWLYIYIHTRQMEKVHLHMIYADLPIKQPVIFQLATLTSQGV